ncbi:hypothetical protein V8G61_09015 [Gaetbulibacter sp. M240]|uniref:hypothetical protein n=1 Tax=Gaetbulibacter sp. M240 TaxID=3126511 RepID=UPI00374E9721
MDSIVTYFNGEKFQCTIGAIASMILIASSIFFLFQQKAFLKGMAYATIPLSILLLVICVGVILRASTDIERVTTFYRNTPQNIQVEEIPRMEKVMKSFNIIRKVEIVFFIIGLALTIIFWRNELIKGLAVGLIIMSVSIYTFDFIAESRGEAYIQFLKSL